MSFVLSVVKKVLEKTFENAHENSLAHNVNVADFRSVFFASLRGIKSCEARLSRKLLGVWHPCAALYYSASRMGDAALKTQDGVCRVAVAFPDFSHNVPFFP